MKAYVLSLLIAVALAQGPINTSGVSASSNASVTASTSTSSSPEYTITAVPAVLALASSVPCVWNCMIPIGLADPSGCDDVTNDCACLSAPLEVLGVLTDCVNTVCKSSTSSYGALATSLYQSYCNSLYPADVLSSATSADSSSDAAAAASTSSEAAMSSSAASSQPASKTTSSTVAATSKSAAEPARDFTMLYVLLSLGLLSALSWSVVGVVVISYADGPAGLPRWVEVYFWLFSDPFRIGFRRVRGIPQLPV